MKRIAIIWLAGIGSFTAFALAQEPPAELPPFDEAIANDPPSGAAPGEHRPRPPPHGWGPRSEGGPWPASGKQHPPIEQWLDLMRQRNPQEYERLNALRASDPAAFEEELRARLQQERFRSRLHGAPKAYDFFMSLPPAERQSLVERFQNAAGGAPDAPPDSPRRNPELQRQEQQIRRLSNAYRSAPDDQKENLKAELRTALESAFDLREKQRAEYMAVIEQRLHDVKTEMENRRQLRNDIIGRRLKELTEGDPLAW